MGHWVWDAPKESPLYTRNIDEAKKLEFIHAGVVVAPDVGVAGGGEEEADGAVGVGAGAVLAAHGVKAGLGGIHSRIRTSARP